MDGLGQSKHLILQYNKEVIKVNIKHETIYYEIKYEVPSKPLRTPRIRISTS